MTIEWSKLGFSYRETNAYIRYDYRAGEWSGGELCRDPQLHLHVAATALHYGQAAFEGLKVFACKDGSIRAFRFDENWKRLVATARRVLMPEVPRALFQDALERVVRANLEFVPPYGTGGSLYIRPLLIGTGPRIGVQAADEYAFVILVVPVGSYYKGGLEPVSALVLDGFDRTAPHGLGNVKVAGNYAASLEPARLAKEQGYPINLFLDPVEHRYVDEFSTSNFIAITRDRRYVTPQSSSILPSITNKTLMTLAAENGLPVEQRRVAFDEIATFAEVAACGTAVVITPVNRIVRGDQVIAVGPRQGCGPVLLDLYHQVRAIQQGETADRWGWTHAIAPA